MNFGEAFRALEALNEDTFSVSDDGIKKLAEFQDNDDIADNIEIIDPEAENEEELEDSYVGKVILDCSVCHSKIYKDKEEITLDEEESLANVGEECPYCYTSEGFKVIGEVAEFGGKKDNEEKDEPEDDNEDGKEHSDPVSQEVEESLKNEAEINESVATLDRPMSALQGTLSNVLTAHQDELANIVSRDEAVDFLAAIENEVRNKEYLDRTKKKVMGLPDRRVLPFLYNIILKGDGMGSKLESVEEGLFSKKKSNKATGTFKVVHRQHNETVKGGFKTKDDAYDWIENNIEPHENSMYSVIAESLEENINNINVETDDSVVNVSSDDNGKVAVTTEPKENSEIPEDGKEVIVPTTEDTENEIMRDDLGEDDVDVDIDEFDEESFDELGESYLKRVYENVNSYKTKNVTSRGNNIIVEGVINFASGSSKETKFIFEAKDCTKSGKYRFTGENAQLARGKKPFSISGKIHSGKFITESFNYNYRAINNGGKSDRVYGTIKR